MNAYQVTYYRSPGKTATVTIRQSDIGAAAEVFRRSAKKQLKLDFGSLRASSPYEGTMHHEYGAATIKFIGTAK